MRILITGPMGYVGPGVIRRLRERFPNAELIGFDSGYFAHNLTGAMRLPEALLDRLHFGDIRNFPPDLLDGVDAVVHLAAISNDPMGKEFESRHRSDQRKSQHRTGADGPGARRRHLRLCFQLQHLRCRRRRPTARERRTQSVDGLRALQGRHGERASIEQCRTNDGNLPAFRHRLRHVGPTAP